MYIDVEAARFRQGDLIEVRPGEVVPADARLIDVVDLEVDESTLTGESLPVPKQLDATPGGALAERSCMLFAATTVVAGTGLAVVTAVGSQTEVRRAAEVPRAERGAVGLQTRLREMTDRSLPVSLAGGGLVSALALVRGAGLRRAVASDVAVIIAAVPEGLALVSTLAQQASARRLTKLGALVRTPRLCRGARPRRCGLFRQDRHAVRKPAARRQSLPGERPLPRRRPRRCRTCHGIHRRGRAARTCHRRRDHRSGWHVADV